MAISYLLTSPKLDGTMEAEYDLNGYLTSFKLDLKTPLTVDQFRFLVCRLPYRNDDIEQNMAPIKVKLKMKSNEKIAFFCKVYEQYKGIKYKVSPADCGKIKHVEINESLLKTYFSSENFLFKNKQSIANFVKYYNELRAEAAGKINKYPAEYNREFEKSLTNAQELEGYWKHLRSLGLKAVKNPLGKIIDWK
jgi:hypothetical protein